MLLTRRNFLRTSLIGGLGAAASLLALCLPWAKELRADDAQDPVPRAPGALPEGEFENRCIRCGACVRVCPSKTLEFGTLEKDPRRLWAPRRNLDRPCYFPDCRRCAKRIDPPRSRSSSRIVTIGGIEIGAILVAIAVSLAVNLRKRG